ncbi:hypothetical protein T492DRAFT_1085228, partial [Pavlovales sp. CCMP2436]
MAGRRGRYASAAGGAAAGGLSRPCGEESASDDSDDSHDEDGPRKQGRKAGNRARPLSLQVMEIFVWQSLFLGFDVPYIAYINRTAGTGICEKTVHNTLKRFRETGAVDFAPRKSRIKRMTALHEQAMLEIVDENTWLYLSEISDEMYLRFPEVARGRDEVKRAAYWHQINSCALDPSWLEFADETAMNGRTMRRKHGWGAVGQRVSVVEVMHRGKMISVLAFFTTEGFVSWRYV